MRSLLLIFVGLFIGSPVFCQERLEHLDFLKLVANNHPVALQAQLVKEQADWEARAGRGFLDPKLVSKFETKDFKEKDYYDLWNSYLSIPTPLNFELKAGFEQNSGIYLNRQNTVPADGLYYAGISVPLGRGLLLSENVYRRNEGKLEGEKLKVETDLILNNLLLDASATYWNWVSAQKKLVVIEGAAVLAKIRFEAVKEAFMNGDKPAIDTTESLIQYQNLRNIQSKAKLDSISATLMLKNFTWYDSLSPIPPDSILSSFPELLGAYETAGLEKHPDLRDLQVKQQKLQNDKRYFREQVRPAVDLNYNFLLENGTTSEFNTNDYKAGISFSMPLLLRKERSKLKITKLKINSTDLKADQKTQEVLNKIRSFYAKAITVQNLLIQQRQITSNYERLLDGERRKFNNGESSIFLINSRQNKLLDSRVKLIDYEIQYQIYYQSLLWASALIQDQLI